MEVQDVGLGGTGIIERSRPRVDLAAVGAVVEAGEDAVRGVGAVLEGGVHRRRGAGRVERVGRVQGGAEVDLAQVQAAVEAPRVTMAAGVTARAGDDRDLPALVGQARRQRAHHVGRPAARKEHRGANDAATHGRRMLRARVSAAKTS